MRRAILAIIGLVMLASCTEDEKACYEKLDADFTRYAETAAKMGDNQGALAARKSALAISLIWSDDDRSACDYVSAGPYLERK